jgi:hypothetical protein
MKDESTVKVPTLPRGDRTRIARAVCEALDTRDNTGGIITQVCNTARSIMRGKPFPAADMDAIVQDIAHDRGWKGDAIKVRSSEVRTILHTYAVLPEAIKHAQSKGACNWHFALKMARVLKKNPKLAIASVYSKAGKASASAPVSPEGRIASALKALWKEKRAKRSTYTKVWELLGLKGDIA